MPLIYSFVARSYANGNYVILVEAIHSLHQGNYKIIGQKLLQRLSSQYISNASILAATGDHDIENKSEKENKQDHAKVVKRSELSSDKDVDKNASTTSQSNQSYDEKKQHNQPQQTLQSAASDQHLTMSEKNARFTSLNTPHVANVDSSNSTYGASTPSSLTSTSSSSSASTSSSYNERQTLLFEGHTFNFFRRGTLWFLCVADRAIGQVKPYAYLNDAIDTYMRATNDGVSILEGASLRALSEALSNKLEVYSKDRADTEHHQQQALQQNQPEKHYHKQLREEEDEPVIHVKRELAGVKNVLLENLDRVIARGEALESLVDRSDQLSNSAENFKAQSTRLKYNMCWSSARTAVTYVIVILLIVYLFASFKCSLTLQYCFGNIK